MSARGSGFGRTYDPENKVLLRTSVSTVSMSSPHEYGGCNRKFFFSKIRGIEEPKTTALDVGSDVHAQIEHYEKTGEDTLGTIARQGKHFIPEPGEGILIEHPFGNEQLVREFGYWRQIQEAVTKGEASRERAEAWFKEHIPSSALYAHGVPFVGYIDVVNLRKYWLDTDGVKQPMPPNSVELHDHKTTSNINLYAKSHLEDTVQMIGYAEWAHRQWPQLELFRLSHGYFQTKGRGAEKRTVLISLDTVQEKWKGIEEQVLRMTQVARETDVKNVEPNYDSCNAYGRNGCFYKSICPRDPDRVLMDLLAPAGASLDFGEPRGDSQMSSLFDMFNDAVPATVHAPPPPVAPTIATTPPPANLEEAKAKLLATEAAARAAGGVVAAVTATTATPPLSTPATTAVAAPTAFLCKVCQGPLTSSNTAKLPNGIVWHIVDPAPHDSGISADAAQAAIAPQTASAPVVTAPPPVVASTAPAATSAGAATLAEVKAAMNGSAAHTPTPAASTAWEDPFEGLGSSPPATPAPVATTPVETPKNAVAPPDAPTSGPPDSALHIPPEQKLGMPAEESWRRQRPSTLRRRRQRPAQRPRRPQQAWRPAQERRPTFRRR